MTTVQVLSPRSHALQRPDMYLGRIAPMQMHELVFLLKEVKPDAVQEYEEASLQEDQEAILQEDQEAQLDAADVVNKGAINPDNDTDVVVDEIKGKVKEERVAMKGERRSAANIELCTQTVQVECSPALLKLVDELVTNALDNATRCPKQRNIKMRVSENGQVHVWNDGSTLCTGEFEESGHRIPEVVFSQMFSGTNFDETVEDENLVRQTKRQRTGAGRNGLGAKICNLYATVFCVHLNNADEGIEYEQKFEANMSVVHPPSIKKSKKKKSFTHVWFMPDYARLGMQHVVQSGTLSYELQLLIQSRAYDAAACAPSHVSVWLNEQKLPIQSLQQYARAIGIVENGGMATDRVVDKNESILFEVCVAAKRLSTPSGYEPNSNKTESKKNRVAEESEHCTIIGFVNGVRCSNGSHMAMIVRKVGDIVCEKARSKSKNKEMQLRALFLRREAVIVARLTIPDPRFTSQLKDTLDTPIGRFGFVWTPSIAFVNAIERSHLVTRAVAEAMEAEERALEKSTKMSATSQGGAMNPRIVRIENYDPATELFRRKDCALILTEGLSAKALCVAGISAVADGRKRFGIFPLKGKLMNASKFTLKRAMENAEVSNLTTILGLQYGVDYTSDAVACRRLPYQKVIIFTDADIDGAHIAGLVINFLHTYYPSLLQKFPCFVRRFATPIVQITLRGGEQRGFFSLAEYREWQNENPDAIITKHKYYKGLGTSSNADAKRYFSHMAEHVTSFAYSGAPCTEALSLFFNEKCADKRKTFLLEEYAEGTYIDYRLSESTMHAFLRNEMAHFSFHDNVRSLPSAIDGLKVSQRKVMFTMLERKQTQEVKIAQAGSIVAERTEYHHGEVSLVECIVSLSQSHVGSGNNLPLLHGVGQVGSRHNKNSVHAAPRYIYTQLDSLARIIFPAEDDAVLDYIVEEGRAVEPRFFVPVIPLVMVNGASGIGTGWSVSLPSFNPLEVVEHCLSLAAPHINEDKKIWTPWFAHFKGRVLPKDETSEQPLTFEVHGVALVQRNRVDSCITVTELPIGVCTEAFLKHVREKLVPLSAREASHVAFVRHVENLSTDESVVIHLYCYADVFPTSDADVVKALKLTTSVSLTNIHLFDACGKLRRFTIEDIFAEHATVRIATYAKRRQFILDHLARELTIAQNKARFVEEVVSGTLRLFDVSINEAEVLLTQREYVPMPTYAYMLDMKISSLTKDRAASLTATCVSIEKRIALMQASTPSSLWHEDLLRLHKSLLLATRSQEGGI